MSIVHIELTKNRRAAIEAAGFRLPGRAVLELPAGSTFEQPTNLSAVFIGTVPINVGAFTLLNGPALGACDIGRYCSMAPGVTVGAAEHPIEYLTTSTAGWHPNFLGWKDGFTGPHIPVEYRGRPRTSVGNDVWIGQNAFVRSGVRIGDGAVVAAGAVVTKDVPDFAVVGGVPARTIRYRFDQKIRERISEIKWWRYCIYDFGVPVNRVEELLDWIEKASLPEFAPRICTAEGFVSFGETDLTKPLPDSEAPPRA